ncbi:MAG: hypothetical protein JKY95_10295 [Planctomycetaceae bacterium]|nr:hypothetical protein [Planctomycetaceae bacterium]
MIFDSPSLIELRKKPELYLGCRSLVRLRPFIAGLRESESAKSRIASDKFFTGFTHWLVELYSFPSAVYGWEKIISADSMDDRDAYDRFWKLYDEYRSQLMDE